MFRVLNIKARYIDIKKQFTLMCNGVFPVQHQTLFVDTRTLRHTVSPLQHYVNDKPCPESLLSPNAKCCGVSVPTYTQYANQILYRPSKIHKRTLDVRSIVQVAYAVMHYVSICMLIHIMH